MARPERSTILIQCKHIQGSGPCTHAAVEQVIASRTRYPDDLKGRVHFLVVSNAERYSGRAITLAQRKGVDLIGRGELLNLNRYRPRFGSR